MYIYVSHVNIPLLTQVCATKVNVKVCSSYKYILELTQVYAAKSKCMFYVPRLKLTQVDATKCQFYCVNILVLTQVYATSVIDTHIMDFTPAKI